MWQTSAVEVKEKLFILRKIKYGDADLILSCLTPKGAKISLYARSAMKSKKRFGGGVLEPTHYIHALYDDKTSRSHSENPLHTLKEASLIEGFNGLRTDYNRIEAALYFVSLISNVVREGEIRFGRTLQPSWQYFESRRKERASRLAENPI